VSIGGRPAAMANDAVVVCIGGTLPTALLADAGVRVETRYGTP
jgi:thioredoxin reductase (NADPH)